MSLLPDFSHSFGVESLDPEIAAQLQPLLSHLANNFESIRNALSALSLEDNLACEIVSAGFKHGVAQNVSLKKLKKAGSALVLSAKGASPLGTPDVEMVGDQEANITVWFTDTLSGASIQCTLLLLQPGGRSSQT